MAAIYSCKFFHAFWPEAWIIWLLVGLFALLIGAYRLWMHRYAHAAGSLYVWLIATAALMLYEQITFYGLYSRAGILPLLLVWILTFFVPVSSKQKDEPVFAMFLGIFLYAPALFFFIQQGPPSIMNLPRTLLATVITSSLIVAYRLYQWEWFSGEDTEDWWVIHHLHWYLMQAHSLLTMFGLTTAAVLAVHVLSFLSGPELFARQLFSMLVVQSILTVYWFDMARKDRKWWWTVAAEAMITGIIFTLRQDLPILFHLPWTLNWDLAIGMFAAFAITAFRPLLKRQDKSIRLPIRFTLFSLPIITIMYALDFQVGFDVLSRVILLYSILFIWQAYSERDRYVLSYAFLGINTYLALLFLHNEIHSPQAYVTPVCISILILVQVFRDITSRATANLVRGVTLFILLGMSIFQAVVQNATSPLAHLILISLSILSVVAAIFLQIRIFCIFRAVCFCNRHRRDYLHCIEPTEYRNPQSDSWSRLYRGRRADFERLYPLP